MGIANHNLHSSTQIYPEVTKQRCKLLLQKLNVSYSLHVLPSFEESIRPQYLDHLY